MADEAPGGVEAAEAEVAREEAGPEAQQQEEQQQEPEAITSLASEMGWAPKDQWNGDPNEWKTATQYIKDGRDINRNLSRELRSVRDEVSRISRTSADLTDRLVADKIAERDAYWQRVHADAVKKDDPALAERAVEERIKLAGEAEKAKARPDEGPPPETAAFVERHKSWFNVDPLATMRAQEVCDQLAKRGVPIPEQLVQAERLIRKEFPEHFSPSAKPPARVDTGQSRSSGPGNKAKGFADMPAESQKMARDFLERHGIPLEKTAESYWKEQNERKVG